jgi:hypothetical protein
MENAYEACHAACHEVCHDDCPWGPKGTVPKRRNEGNPINHNARNARLSRKVADVVVPWAYYLLHYPLKPKSEIKEVAYKRKSTPESCAQKLPYLRLATKWL